MHKALGHITCDIDPLWGATIQYDILLSIHQKVFDPLEQLQGVGFPLYHALAI